MTASDAAFAPVSYTMPYARLRRLSRRASRRSYPRVWYFTWGWIGLFLASCLLISIFPGGFNALVGELVRQLGVTIGVAETLVFGLFVGVFFVGFILIQRLFHSEHAARINFDALITLAPAQAGLHLAGAEIDYILKWSGIHELFASPTASSWCVGGCFSWCQIGPSQRSLPGMRFSTMSRRI